MNMQTIVPDWPEDRKAGAYSEADESRLATPASGAGHRLVGQSTPISDSQHMTSRMQPDRKE